MFPRRDNNSLIIKKAGHIACVQSHLSARRLKATELLRDRSQPGLHGKRSTSVHKYGTLQLWGKVRTQAGTKVRGTPGSLGLETDGSMQKTLGRDGPCACANQGALC